MTSVSYNFNMLTFAIKIILDIKIRLGCVVMCIICGGVTNHWNLKSGRIESNLINPES